MRSWALLAGSVSAINGTVSNNNDMHFNATTLSSNGTKLADLPPVPGAKLCPPAGNFNDDPDGTKIFPKGYYLPDYPELATSKDDYQKCIYVVNHIYLKHSQAELACQKNLKTISTSGSGNPITGTLIAIHDAAQNQKIWDWATSLEDTNGGAPYWIGIRRDCLGPGCGFEWADFSKVDFVNWGNGEPNDAGEGEQCGEMTMWNGNWNDDNCGTEMQFLCQLFLDDSHPKPTGDESWPSSGNCQPGWTRFAKGCYKLFGDIYSDPEFTEGTGWELAQKQCQSKAGNRAGAGLAIFPNIHYQYFATSRMRNSGRTVWIGAKSTMQDSTFHWWDKSRLTYTNWMPNEPNDAGDGEDYVEMIWWADHVGNTHEAGMWNDLADDRNLAYMCSHHVDPSLQQTPDGDCPIGWIAGTTGNCYKMITGQDTDFDGAETACQTMSDETGHDTHLASVMDLYEMNLVTALFYNENTNYNPQDVRALAWVGLSGYRTSDTKTVKWSWTDGYPIVFTKWANGEPATGSIQVAPGKSCVYIDEAMQMHIDNRCNAKLQFICKTNTNDVHPIDTSGDDRGELLPCDQTYGQNWHESSLEPGKGHYCFKVFNTKVDWYEAEYWCAWHAGGHLTSIHSAAYGDLIHSVAMNEVNTNKYWIGMTRDSSGGEIWSDGSQLSYTNWAPGEPSITDEDCTEADQNCNEDCVEAYDNGMWNDIICQVKRPYVCKAPRPQKNCLDIPELEKDMCGYPGITQIECTATYACCYNAYAPLQCYKPQRKKDAISPGTAAGIACAIWIPITLVVLLYFVKIRNS